VIGTVAVVEAVAVEIVVDADDVAGTVVLDLEDETTLVLVDVVHVVVSVVPTFVVELEVTGKVLLVVTLLDVAVVETAEVVLLRKPVEELDVLT
jgi:hypothetical protein